MQELKEGSADTGGGPELESPPAAATPVTQIAATLAAPISSLFLIVVSSRSLGA
jgi:hypothetical protein